tara:strand:+ start:119 stop:379 length:261 start_codon:yes stop_codon:yes gene_type:complete
MSLFKTYTNHSRRIFEAAENNGENNGENDGVPPKPSGERTGTVSKEEWKQWRDYLTKQTEKQRKKMIKIKWKNLVALLKKRTMHTK